MLLVKQQFYTNWNWVRLSRQFQPLVSMLKLSSTKTSASLCGMWEVRTRSGHCGAITTKVLMVLFSLWTAMIVIVQKMRVRSYPKCWVKMRCVMLFALCLPTNRTCQMQCLPLRSQRNWDCTTCVIGNGSSNLHVPQPEMVCTKDLIGCPTLCQRRNETALCVSLRSGSRVMLKCDFARSVKLLVGLLRRELL